MARTDPTIYMRLPQELKERLDAAAASNHCSLTSEVVRRLEQTFGEAIAQKPSGLDGLQRAAERMEQSTVVSSLRMRYETLRFRLDHLMSRQYDLEWAVRIEKDKKARADLELEISKTKSEAQETRDESERVMQQIQVANTRLLSLQDRDFNTHLPKPTDPNP